MNKNLTYTSFTAAMNKYNKAHNYNFTIIDALTISTLHSNTYTTDADLAQLLLCSDRTIKRSINKLCSLGLAQKHFAQDNTKTVQVNRSALNNFINTYSGDFNE